MLFLIDTTGSMITGGESSKLTAVQSAITPAFLAGIEAAATGAFAPDTISISWAAAEYKDVVGTGSFPTGWDISAPFGAAGAAATAIGGYGGLITDGGGTDPFEANYTALVEAAGLWDTPSGGGGLGGTGLGSAERIVVWIGDGGAHEALFDHEPAGDGPEDFAYPTTFQALSALREQSVAVYGINLGASGGAIDSIGSISLPQATTIAGATGGRLG